MIDIDYRLFLTICIMLIFGYIVYYINAYLQEKKNAKKAVDTALKMFEAILNISKEGILILSDKHRIIYANEVMAKTLQFDAKFLLRVLKNIPQVKIEKKWIPLESFLVKNHEKLLEKVAFYPNILISHAWEIPIDLYLYSISTGKKNYYDVIVIKDLREEIEKENLKFQHALTRLPNQIQALTDLPQLFAKVHSENNQVALVIMEIDNFDRLRSIVGYQQANDLVIKFATHLESVVSNLHLSVYHTFENHFLLTISNVDSSESTKKFIEDVQKKVSSFYKLRDSNLHLTLSVGIAVFPESGTTRTLLDNAYKALVEAKKNGDGSIAIYTDEKDKNAYNFVTLNADMQSSLDNGDFEVYYQPIVKARTSRVVSAEALIRWNHPTLGLIPPDVFISLMEQTGFIIKLGQYILEEVLKQQKRWQMFQFKQATISINLSMIEIETGEFVQNVEKQLHKYEVDPQLIKFEITESVAMKKEEEVQKYFFDLRRIGIGLSLDDFGTGYTSFSHLKKIPINLIKVDRVLIEKILTSEEDKRIVKAIIDLGHNLGMQVLIEGVENEKMAQLLIEYGCDYFQGYLYGKPLPVYEFQELIR